MKKTVQDFDVAVDEAQRVVVDLAVKAGLEAAATVKAQLADLASEATVFVLVVDGTTQTSVLSMSVHGQFRTLDMAARQKLYRDYMVASDTLLRCLDQMEPDVPRGLEPPCQCAHCTN